MDILSAIASLLDSDPPMETTRPSSGRNLLPILSAALDAVAEDLNNNTHGASDFRRLLKKS
jgi:hypothetical protein